MGEPSVTQLLLLGAGGSPAGSQSGGTEGVSHAGITPNRWPAGIFPPCQHAQTYRPPARKKHKNTITPTLLCNTASLQHFREKGNQRALLLVWCLWISTSHEEEDLKVFTYCLRALHLLLPAQQPTQESWTTAGGGLPAQPREGSPGALKYLVLLGGEGGTITSR